MQPSGFAAGPPISASGIYDTASNPPIARLSTYNKKIGGGQSAEPTLGIVEIDPLESRLEIYYETSTSGLISELNAAIAAGSSATPTTPTPKHTCLLYTSPSPRDGLLSRMPSSA